MLKSAHEIVKNNPSSASHAADEPVQIGQNQAQKGAQINPPAADILPDCDDL
jgi:hypothetical protein